MSTVLRLALPAISLACALSAQSKPAAQSARLPKADVPMMRASGTFDVKMTPQALADASADPLLGRLSLDKQFHGDLVGTSKGEMLAARTAVTDSAGYVAIEHVTGTLGGRKGTFVLQHSGTMTRGEQQLVITVVPDSGTGELAGLGGTMTIRIAEGKHFYELTYAFK